MSGDYEKLKVLETDDAIPAKERKRLFETFLSSYAANNIYSSRDEALRREARSVLDRLDSSGKVYVDPVTGMEFVWVPGGCYQMGSNKGDSDEKPVHEVCLDGYWMGKYEVTNRQYRKFKPSYSSKDYRGVGFNGDDQPAVNVSWNDAKAFISWLNGKTGKTLSLPTEAQWEYACRAETVTVRYWGDGAGEACAYASVWDEASKRVLKNDWPFHTCNDGYAGTSPVGRFKPNNFGLYDMLGNASEWCEDGYDKNAYTKHGRNNPVIINGSERVLRGGPWFGRPRDVRCADRLELVPSGAGYSVGFRLVLSGHK